MLIGPPCKKLHLKTIYEIYVHSALQTGLTSIIFIMRATLYLSWFVSCFLTYVFISSRRFTKSVKVILWKFINVLVPLIVSYRLVLQVSYCASQHFFRLSVNVTRICNMIVVESNEFSWMWMCSIILQDIQLY